MSAREIRVPNEWRPRPYQRAMWRYLERGGKRGYAVWHRRCLGVGSLVALADGRWAAIETLTPGQEILSWDGERLVTDRIKHVWNAGVKQVVSCKASGFPALISTPDHRFFGVRCQGEKVGWSEVDQFSSRRLSVLQYGKTMQGDLSAPDLAELVGYLVTDGYVCHGQQPKFTNNHEPMVDRVAELARKLFDVTPIKRVKKSGFDLGLSNGTKGGGETPNPLKTWFFEQNALEKKANRRLPKQVWQWDEETLWRFFGAVIDGDGSIYAQKRARHLIDATRGPREIQPAGQVIIHAGVALELANGFAQLLRKLGIVARVGQLPDTNNWTVRITRQDHIARFLSNIHTVSKETKRLSALNCSLGRRKRVLVYGCEKAIPTLKEAGVSEVWDIETETHNCFFANGYLVHNSGKDDLALNWTAVSAMQKPATYWHMLPEASQARKAIWEAVNPHTGIRRIDQAFPHAIRAATRENEMFIRFVNGATWQVVGSDNFNSLVGSPPYGIVFSEWALSRPSAWSFLSPILRENGGWALFITTPRGDNHAGKMFNGVKNDPEWFAERLSAPDTGVFTPADLDKERTELVRLHGQHVGDAIFDQEYMCSFTAAIAGQVYAAELRAAQADGRITRVPYDRSKPVDTFWDLGWADSTSIWFVQQVGFETRVIDFEQGSGLQLSEYLSRVQARPYVYRHHWLPHDARAKQLGSGRSVEEMMRDAGVPVRIVPSLAVADGINALRTIFPSLWFDEAKCAQGIEALSNYRYDVKEGQLSKRPLHDWASHASDAARYMAIGLGQRQAVKPPPAPQISLGTRNPGLSWMAA